ncbi:MAG: YgeY family selenium metabolism-linked hydrolase [Treponema sp.]|jgi:putative selenium metabolism hydrolase|nr:YgeY family selenium metabolism-linked hydrolase [Treponema sp.]
MLSGERKADLTDLCRELISLRSYSGGEKAVADALRAYMEKNRFDEVRTDAYGNVIGRIRGRKPGKRLLFDGHIDTVPVGNEAEWTHKPFGADMADGRIYGRGSTDMKGAVAAFTAAAGYFAGDLDRNFPGEIFVAGVVHEECFEGVAARKISELVRPDFVIIGEASDLNLKIGQRGRAEVVVETFGVPAHSANPEKGLNAVYKMCRVVEAIRTLTPPEHPVLGKGIMELTDIQSHPYPGASVVPEYCRVTYDRRLLVGETRERVLAPVQALLDRLAAEDPALKARVSFARGREICYTGEIIEGERFFPGWLYDEGEPFVQRVLGELRAMSRSPQVTRYNFCTNGSHYAGEAGIPTIGLGPSREDLAHTIDEYIEVDQLTGAAECYYGVMKALLREDGADVREKRGG